MKISTILPLYNGKKFIKEAIDSVRSQTYTNWELIIINDGSTDDSLEYTTAYVNSLPEKDKIKIIDQENTDVAIARNNAISYATGDWIALLDQDDYFHPEKFLSMMSLAEDDSGIDVFVSQRYKITDSGIAEDLHSNRKKTDMFSSEDIITNVILGTGIAPIETLFKRDAFNAIGGLDSSLRMSNDWDLWVRFAQHGYRYYYVEKPLAYYRVHDANTTQFYERFVPERFKILEKFFSSCDSRYLHLQDKAFAYAYRESANPRFNGADYSNFRKDVFKVITLYPKALNIKLIRRFFISYFKQIFGKKK